MSQNESEDIEGMDFAKCTGKFLHLLDKMLIGKDILKDLHVSSAPIKHSAIINITDLCESIKITCEDVLSTCKEYVENHPLVLNSVDKDCAEETLVQHDPGLRKVIETENQREFLISLGPYQPKIAIFPPDNTNHRFNPNWYREFEFLEYSAVKDKAYCFVCSLFSSPFNKNWGKEGVANWKKMRSTGEKKLGKLQKHFSSEHHKKAVCDYISFMKKKSYIDVLLSKEAYKISQERERIQQFNTEIVEILLDIARTLARQGLAFRGTGDDKDGNFFQLVQLVGRHNPVLQKWLKDKDIRPYKVSYLSPQTQNEFIQLLSEQIRQKVQEEIQEAKFFSVLADTTPDASNKDMLSIVIRTVDENGIPRERLLSMIEATDKTGAGIANLIIQNLKQNGLNTDYLAFQSYDFASAMSGCFNGAQKNVSDLVGHKVPYIPCQAHRTNSAVEHCCTSSTMIKNVFDILEELYVFFNSSTKRYALIKETLQPIENSTNLKNLSKTRWTARAETLNSIVTSYESIIELMDDISASSKMDYNTKTKAYGLKCKIASFDFLVSMMFMKHIMNKMKLLTETFESEKLNVIDVLTVLKSCVQSLNLIRESKNEVENLIHAAAIIARKVDIDPEAEFKKQHRRRRIPKRFDSSNENQTEMTFHQFYRSEFYKVLDSLTMEMKEKIENLCETLNPFHKLLEIPLKRENLSLENLKQCLEFYPHCTSKPDIYALQTEMEALFDSCAECCSSLVDVVENSRKMKNLLKLAFRFFQLIVTASYSTAANERKFSGLKIVKNHLRTIMADERLDELMLLYSEKDLTDQIKFEKIMKVWVALKNRRIKLISK